MARVPHVKSQCRGNALRACFALAAIFKGREILEVEELFSECVNIFILHKLFIFDKPSC